MARILLGTGVTNKQGITQLNTNTSGNALTHSYTGTGAGELKLTARVYGVGFKDNGVTGDNNTDWYNSSDRLTVTTDTTGTLLTATDNNGYYICNLPDTSTNSIADTQEFTVPLVIEGDCVSISKTGTGTDAVTGLWLNDGTTEIVYKMVTFDGAVTNGDHFKIVLDGSTGKLYVNGNTPTTTSLSLSGLMNLGLSVKAGSTLKYKNFRVYDMEHGLISQEYKVYDCKFKDMGTSTSYTAWTSDSNFTVSRSDVETTITPMDNTAYASRYLTISSYTVPFNIEFDFCMDFTGNAGSNVMSIRQGNSSKASVSPNALGLTSGEYSHIKLTVTSTELQINVDGTDKTPITHDGTFNRFYITQNANALWQSIKYKNFIIYPTGSA